MGLDLDLDLEFGPWLLNFSILGISSGHQAIVLAWVWATLIHSGCQTRLRIVPPRRCNDSEHNRAPPCHYDAVSSLSPHIASRIVNVRQCWMHLDSLLSHCLRALVAVKPGVSLTKNIHYSSIILFKWRGWPCPGPRVHVPGPRCISGSPSHVGSGSSPSVIIFPLSVFK